MNEKERQSTRLWDISREPYGRRALIAAAAEIFSERGYEAASVHEICKLAGTNVALVKYHFGSKEGLYEAVVEAVYEEKLSGFVDLVKDVRDAASWQAAMREWIRRFVEITGNPDSPRNFVARIVSREFATPSPLHDKIKARFYVPLREAFAKLVRMAFPESLEPADEIRIGLWSSALGALCFSHTAVRPSWAEIYCPPDISRSDWADAEVEWMCRLVFSQLSYRGG